MGAKLTVLGVLPDVRNSQHRFFVRPTNPCKAPGVPGRRVGIAVGEQLNKTNASAYKAAYQNLGPEPGDYILEVGFGNGHLVPEVLALAAETKYSGIDISEEMVREATRFNAEAVADGRVRVQVASSAAMPLENASLDRALALNTIYFWEAPEKDLAEIRRVLRPGGRLVLGAVHPNSTKGVEAFRHGFRFYDAEQLRAMLTEAAFASVEIELLTDTVTRPNGATMTRDYFLVTAV